MPKLDRLVGAVLEDYSNHIDADRSILILLLFHQGARERAELGFLRGGDVCFRIDLARVILLFETRFDLDEHYTSGLGFFAEQIDLAVCEPKIAREDAVPIAFHVSSRGVLASHPHGLLTRSTGDACDKLGDRVQPVGPYCFSAI